MNNDRETIRLLKAELQDLQDKCIEASEDITIDRIIGVLVREAISRSKTMSEAAQRLGVDRATMRRYVMKYEIEVRMTCDKYRPRGWGPR